MTANRTATRTGAFFFKAGLALCAATAVAGCSGGGTVVAERPGWSLADKPEALGGPAKAQAAAPANTSVAEASPYEYRGGRDPVTGLAATHYGAPETTGSVRSASPVPAGGDAARLVEVRKGDTLHGLSLTHHVSVKALMAANNLSSTTIVPGQKLIVPPG